MAAELIHFDRNQRTRAAGSRMALSSQFSCSTGNRGIGSWLSDSTRGCLNLLSVATIRKYESRCSRAEYRMMLGWFRRTVVHPLLFRRFESRDRISGLNWPSLTRGPNLSPQDLYPRLDSFRPCGYHIDQELLTPNTVFVSLRSDKVQATPLLKNPLGASRCALLCIRM